MNITAEQINNIEHSTARTAQNESKAILEKLRGRVEGIEEDIKAAKTERDKLTDYFDTYTQQVQSDYDFLLEMAREEQERKAQAVQIEEHEQERKNYHYEK